MKIESMFTTKLCHDIKDAIIIPTTCYAMLIALRSHRKNGHVNNVTQLLPNFQSVKNLHVIMDRGCLGIPEQSIVGYCDTLSVDTIPAVH